MDANRIEQLIHSSCEKNGCPELASQVTVNWSNRMTSAKGYAFYKENRIQLSSKLFALDSQEGNEATVVHEVCHLIARYRNPKCKPHGTHWKIAMRNAGYSPERCHNVDIQSVRRKVVRHFYVCPNCGKEYGLTTFKHHKVQLGYRSYACGVCHTKLEDADYSAMY